jgi:hypothetical protein
VLLRGGGLALALLIAACGGDDDDTLGDCSGIEPASAVLVASNAAGVIADVSEGAEVELIAAPQGGHILLVGARIKADGGCKLDATGALRDIATSRVIGLEQRPMLLEPAAGGYVMPRQGLDAMPNVAVCPSAAATTSVDANPYRLELHLATSEGETITDLAATVTPTCTSDYCRSDCAPIADM